MSASHVKKIEKLLETDKAASKKISEFEEILSNIDNLDQRKMLGPTLVKYLERMTKANDQLLSLASLVTKEIEQQNTVSSDDIFEEIEG